jgi:lipopolysaccharide transport system permease protein
MLLEKSRKDRCDRRREPGRHGGLKMIREVMRFRDLLYMMVWRDIRIKYKQSILGVLWAILMPAMIVLAGIAVKVVLSKFNGKPLAARDLANLSVRAVPWAFFIASIRFGTNCLVGNANLVTKIYFPKVIFPLSATLSQFVDFLIACGVLTIILAFLGMPWSWGLLWLPVLIAMLVVLAAGLGIFLSAASLFFRDVKYLVEMFLTFAIFFTPVFFDAAMFGEWKNLLLLNPVAPLLEGISAAVTGQGGLQLGWILYSALVSLAILGGSVLFFEKLEPFFAECI